MKHDLKTYGILLGIFLLSLIGMLVTDDSDDLLQAVVASPGVVALLSALFQLLRDQAAYEKQLDIQNKQFKFTLGAASHMANTAFDKHVRFCELYVTEIHEAFLTIFREGSTPKALEHAGRLFQLRLDHAVWLTSKINSDLEVFESGLRKLGAGSEFVRSTHGSTDYAEQRQKFISSNHKLFIEILGIDEKKEINEKYAVEAAKKKVRSILGVEELTNLREHLISEAMKAIS